MPVQGGGKPLQPVLGGWRLGFLQSENAEVPSRPQNQSIVHCTTLYLGICLKVHPPGGLGNSGNQDPIKTAFLL